MTNNSSLLKLFFLFCTLAFFGCRDSNPVNSPDGQSSPQALIEKARLAICEQDRGAYLECYRPNKRYQDIAIVGYEFLIAHRNFYFALKEAYGDDACEKYNNIDNPEGNITFNPPGALLTPEEISSYIENYLMIEQQGKKARVTDSETSQTYFLCLDNGVWRYEVDEEMEGAIGFIESATLCYKKVIEDIGKPGVTIQDIKAKMWSAWTETP